MLVQEVARPLPAPLPRRPQPLLTFSSNYFSQADSKVQNGHFVLHLLPRGSLLCARPMLGPGIREESHTVSLPREGTEDEATDARTKLDIPRTACTGIYRARARLSLQGELVGKAFWRRRSCSSKVFLHPGFHFEGMLAVRHGRGGQVSFTVSEVEGSHGLHLGT